MMQLVWIDVPGGGFAATVNLSVASLDPNAMPTHLDGSFLSYGVEADENERLLRAERRNDASDPLMYFNISRQHYGFSKNGYRFVMQCADGDRFRAELVAEKTAAARAGK